MNAGAPDKFRVKNLAYVKKYKHGNTAKSCCFIKSIYVLAKCLNEYNITENQIFFPYHYNLMASASLNMYEYTEEDSFFSWRTVPSG